MAPRVSRASPRPRALGPPAIRSLRRAQRRHSPFPPTQPHGSGPKGEKVGSAVGSAPCRELWTKPQHEASMSDDLLANVEREKRAALRQLAYGASHELNNPLANIATRAQSLLADEKDADKRRKLGVIYAQAMRAHEMIADLMLFARPPKVERSWSACAPLVAQAIAEIQTRAAEQETELVCEHIDSSWSFAVDRVQFLVALKALLINSLEALGSKGCITISTSFANENFEFRVTDNGPGFDAAARRHMFDPFFSGREAGRGLGFGLTKAATIVEQHGGSIDVESEPGQGAQFTLRFPQHGPANA